MKPKTNRAGTLYEAKGFDCCQTPSSAAKTLQRFIPPGKIIWESAAGTMRMLVKGIQEYLSPHSVIATDIQDDTSYNFFDYSPNIWDIQITNPPYSIKYHWLKRSYELGKPFALLLPVETIGAKKAQTLMKEYGAEIILLSKRINFYMPDKGLTGGGAQFPTLWFTYGLNIGRDISFAEVE